MASNIFAPAPWSLEGNAWAMLYHFPHSFVSRWGFLEEYQHQSYRGWLGAVILADYKHSNVGPYQELIFIPGLFKLGGTWAFSISKIWVSSEASLQNGRRNWGIPKELANFTFTNSPSGTKLKVQKGESLFFEASLKSNGPSVPFSSRFLPLVRLVQEWEHQRLGCKPRASGKLKLASLENAWADEKYFPPLQHLTPLTCLSVSTLEMQFPAAKPLQYNF